MSFPLQIIIRNSDSLPPFIDGLSLGHGLPDSVVLLPNNQPPADGVYLCVVKIYDYWRLSPRRCAELSIPHFSSAIEPKIRDDARKGRVLLLLDLCNEGPEFNRERFDDLHEFLDSTGIPAQHTVWLAQNRVIQDYYARAYRATRRQFMAFEHYDYFVKLMAYWFANEGWRRQAIGDAAEYSAGLVNPDRKDRLALCLNATPRIHRLLAVAALKHFGVLEECLVSFGGMSYEKGNLSERESFLASIASSPDYGFLSDACARVIELGRIRIDDFADIGNQLIDKIDRRHYERTFFSLVTETDFSDGEIVRVTEKLAKTFCMGHPSVVLGNPGSNRLLTDWGFQDFSPLISYEYDSTSSSAERFLAAFREIQRQALAIRHDPVAWLGQAGEVMQFNLSHATGGFLRHYQQREDLRIVDALARRVLELRGARTAAESSYRHVAWDPPSGDSDGALNIALHKPAAQSSRSEWSREGDPQRGNNGVRTGGFSFHTSLEVAPWWQVDLQEECAITEIRIYNRLDACSDRARSLTVLLSSDGIAWRLIHDQNGSNFGGVDGHPLRVFVNHERARFVRLQLRETQYLHLDEIEIY